MIIDEKQYQPLVYKGSNTNYIISEYGDIINIRSGKRLTPCINSSGRLAVCITIDGKCMTDTVHRLVYMAFSGEIPEGMTINHKNENFTDNHISNLELMTRGENVQAYISNHGPVRKQISDTIVENICQDLKSGIYYRDIAYAYNLPIDYVYRILIGKKRTFVSDKYRPFPRSAHMRRHHRDIPHEYIRSLIWQGYSTSEILDIMDMENSTTNQRMLSRERDVVGIKDPKYFPDELIDKIDNLILSGYANVNIYKTCNLEINNRHSWLLARERKKLGISDYNPHGVSLQIQNEILGDIACGKSNAEIVDKYKLSRTSYIIAMLARLRQKYKCCGSTTIESIP